MELGRMKQLYRLIGKNEKLALRRHPMFEQNRVMKVFIYLFIAFWAVYLFVLGVMFGRITDGNYEAFDMIDGGMIFFLVVDFFVRFAVQETPAQEIKPYKLLPIPQNFLLNVFLLRRGLTGGNLFWGFFFVPFAFFAVLKFYGLLGFLCYLLGWWLMFVLDSYWYLLWRTAIQRNVLFIAFPLLADAALIYFGIFFDSNATWLFDATLLLGRGFCTGSLPAFLLPLLLCVLLFFVNRRIQRRYIYREIAQEERPQQVSTGGMRWLNRFGIIGEYMKLEVKSTRRNKVVRNQFLFGVCYMILFCALLAFTDIYDQPFMRTFICVYCFACLGTMTLTSVMCMEGNYIDFLMSRKESVLQLLKAKYYFNCGMLVFPLAFTLMPVLQGKILWIEALSCCFFTMGCIFPFLFQLAVYNKTTLSLNQKLTRSGRSTKMQMIFSAAALFVPMIIMFTLIHLFGYFTGSWILLSLGLCGTLLSPLWLRNIYRRFLIRRYVNMQGFRSSLER